MDGSGEMLQEILVCDIIDVDADVMERAESLLWLVDLQDGKNVGDVCIGQGSFIPHAHNTGVGQHGSSGDDGRDQPSNEDIMAGDTVEGHGGMVKSDLATDGRDYLGVHTGWGED